MIYTKPSIQELGDANKVIQGSKSGGQDDIGPHPPTFELED
jgi:hypothetical protein